MGPGEARYPRETWPASREFRRVVPPEEVIASIVNAMQRYTGLRVYGLVEEMMDYSNDIFKIKASMARWLRASINKKRQEAVLAPTLRYLRLANKLIDLMGTIETDKEVKSGKLTGLAPQWSNGRWITRGRLGKGMFRVLGVSELMILMPKSRLAYLTMLAAHNQDHKSSSITLWRSRASAWVVRGRRLAELVVRSCVVCIARRAQLVEQRMGNLRSCLPRLPRPHLREGHGQ